MAAAYEGGIGGKIRRRPLRKPPTPHDRPPTAPGNPIANAWISKIVDPASKIITGSATRLFSSVFCKRLTAPPISTPETETHSEARNEILGENPCSGSPEHENVEGENNSHNIGSTGISELEQLLKQKTFTRAEFDRLTELLRSRTVDSLLDGNKSAEPSSSKPVPTQARDERTLSTISEWENGLEPCRLFESVPGRAGSDGGLPVREDEPSSPAELAKAYMGTRPSKVSQSALGLRSQMLRKDSSFLKTMPSGPKSSDLLLAPASSRRVAGFSESNYRTPRPLGRSAIYSMVRTPYTGGHSRLTQQSTLSMSDGSTRFLVSHSDQVGNPPADKQALKRTSCVLDDDFGYVGPIRRIRQKPNLISPLTDVKSLSRTSLWIPETPASSNTVQGRVLSGKKPLLLDGRKDSIMKQHADEDGHDKLSTVNSPFATTQSGEMAKKIFQQLDKLVPSPKEKLLETRVSPSKEKSATKLIYDTSNGKASKSTESTKSPRLQNLQVSGISNGLSGNQLFPAFQNSIAGKQDKAEVNGPIKITDPCRKPSSDVDGGVNIADSDKGIKSAGRPVGSVLFDFAANQSGKKQAPPVNAPKDALVLEGDKDAGKSIPSESCALENKIVAIETIMEKPAIASAKSSQGSIFSTKDASIASTSAADTMKQSSSVFNKPVSAEDGRAAPVFGFDTKNTKQRPVLAFFSNSSSSREISETIFNNRKSEVPNCNASGDAYPEDTGLEKRKRNQKETALETAKSMSTSATSKPSFGMNNNSMVSTISNGSLVTTSLLSSASTPTTSVVGTGRISSSSSATTSASSSISSISQAPLVFSFGALSSTAGTSTYSALSPTSNLSEGSREMQSQKKQVPVTFGTAITSSPATFAFSSGASVPCSSTTSSFSDSNLPKSSTPFGASSSSLFSNASGVAQSTQSMLSQSGSSALSPSFWLSDSSSSGSASSLFGSSSSSKLFGSDSSFGGPSSFAPSFASTSFGLVASSFAASSSSTKNIFSSSSQTSTPSLFSSGNGVASSAAGFSFGAAGAILSGPVFSFGASPAASSATGVSFGASSAAASGFSFGAPSAPATASSPMGFPFAAPATATSSVTGISFGEPAATAPSPTVSSFQASASASASSTTGFSFSTAASAAVTTHSTFQSSQGTSSGAPFSFPSAASSAAASISLSTAQTPFGATNPVNFSSSSVGNDHMNVEDSMAEDAAQASIPASPAFGQAAASPSPLFSFGSPAIASSVPSVISFGSQGSSAGSLPGGNFSLGTSDDKSKRKIVKIRRDIKLRKK